MRGIVSQCKCPNILILNSLDIFLTKILISVFTEAPSCMEERTATLRQHLQDPTGGIFIPLCTDNGKWARAQCHESSEYCWCVDENTGSPIPQTSTHRIQPDCNQPVERQMTGMLFEESLKCDVAFLIIIYYYYY